MIRTLIVDDERLPRERIRTLLADHPSVKIVGECASGEAALKDIEETCPDLLFLDIQMPGIGGFDIVEALPGLRRPVIVFVTAYDDFALKAFEVNALDYVLKPIQPPRFHAAVKRAIAAIESRAGRQAATARVDALMAELRKRDHLARRLPVRRGSQLEFVAVGEVDWIGAAGNYAELHVDGRVHLIRQTLKALEERLDPDQFVRVHRSIIVNLDRVRALEPVGRGEYGITMADGSRFTSSRTYGNRLRGHLG